MSPPLSREAYLAAIKAAVSVLAHLRERGHHDFANDLERRTKQWAERAKEAA